MNLRFLETAKAEFWEAVAYYEQEREGLGGEFAREVSKALDRIGRKGHKDRGGRLKAAPSHRLPVAV